MTQDKPSIIACVTSQFECDRIINKARQIAEQNDCDLRVLSILKPTTDYRSVSGQIEYLYGVARSAGADMTVLFSSNPPRAAAKFADDSNATGIVTGMHDGKNTSFLVKFNSYAPEVAITMVATNGNVYSMELLTSAVAG